MVDSVGGTGSSGAASDLPQVVTKDPNDPTDGLGFDTYLQLLVTQLKNQDPLNPMDATDFTKELATFSQLEQQIKSNTYLDTLTQSQDYGLKALATGYLGKATLVPGQSIQTDGANPTEFGYKLEKDAAKVSFDVQDSTGKTVRTIYGPTNGGTAGTHLTTWDGKDDNGKAVAAGEYKIVPTATDADGSVVTITSYTYGVVAAVSGDGQDVEVEMTDGRTAKALDVLKVANVG